MNLVILAAFLVLSVTGTLMSGILSFILPFLDTHVNAGNRIDHNVVRDNNMPNTCAGGEVCLVPVDVPDQAKPDRQLGLEEEGASRHPRPVG